MRIKLYSTYSHNMMADESRIRRERITKRSYFFILLNIHMPGGVFSPGQWDVGRIVGLGGQRVSRVKSSQVDVELS